MKYSAFCTDLDGTFLSLKNDISDFAVSQIHKIKEQIPIILASARMPQSMTYLQEKMGITDHPMICFNGALIVEKNIEKSIAEIDIATLEAVYKMTAALDIKIGLYHANDWQVPTTSERVEKEIFNTKAQPTFNTTENTLKQWQKENKGAHKVMLMGTKENIDTIFPFLNASFQNSLNSYRSNDTLIELAPKSVTKLTALKCILGEDKLANVLAFGDNYNDIDLLEAVGMGVAVANGREEVKEIADFVTLSCKEDGVAHFLKEHIKKEA